MKSREYKSRDGEENRIEFMKDFVFATEALEYVKELPTGNRWFLFSCAQVAMGIFQITFITNECLSPGHPSDRLYIKAVAPVTADGDWTFSFV